jgi:hypothetical protein
LPLKIAYGVAGCIGYFAGGVLHGASNLVDHASARQIIVTGNSARAFLQLTEQISAGTSDALPASPEAGSVGCAPNLVILGGIPGGTTIQKDVSGNDSKSEGYPHLALH